MQEDESASDTEEEIGYTACMNNYSEDKEDYRFAKYMSKEVKGGELSEEQETLKNYYKEEKREALGAVFFRQREEINVSK